MKKTVFTLFFVTLFLSNQAFSQNDQTEIKKTMKAYFALLEKNDLKSSLDYLYPRFFEVVPKEKIIASMEASKNSEINIRSPKLTKLSEIIKVNQAKYALASYAFKLVIKRGKENAGKLEGVASFFKGAYGDKNVTIDRANHQLIINAKGEMYMINDPAYKGWKVLEKKKNDRLILDKLLPKEVLKKL